MGFKFALTVTFILSVFSSSIRSENLGCSFQGLQLDKCINQNGEYVFLEPCCRAINLAIRDGFHCLCSVLATDSPQFSTLFSWSMSSCYISVPPLTICRDLGTMPVTLPVPSYSPPKMQSSQTNQLVPVSPPPQLASVSSISSTSNNSSNAIGSPTNMNENSTQVLHVSEERNASDCNDAAYVMCFYTWLLSVAVYFMVLVA